MMNAIESDGLSKVYGNTTAVDKLSFSVPKGTVYGFLGPNGAGKTTTMRILTGLIEPTDGTAYIHGNPISDLKAIREHIGYMPERPPLHDYLTAAEQLEYAASIQKTPAADATGRATELLERFDLLDAKDEQISTYSKGMRQKVGLIQSVLHQPNVLFLDEPTSGLDPQSAKSMKETIASFAEEGMTVFLSSHILPVIDELADNVGVLHDGSLIAEESPKKLKNTAKAGSLEDAFIQITTAEAASGTASR